MSTARIRPCFPSPLLGSSFSVSRFRCFFAPTSIGLSPPSPLLLLRLLRCDRIDRRDGRPAAFLRSRLSIRSTFVLLSEAYLALLSAASSLLLLLLLLLIRLDFCSVLRCFLNSCSPRLLAARRNWLSAMEFAFRSRLALLGFFSCSDLVSAVSSLAPISSTLL